MSFSYSGDPSESTLDECRFLLGDTNKDAPIMQDEEIEYLISQSGNDENLLKYTLFSHAATIFARDIKRTLGPQSEDPTKRLEFFNSKAEEYKHKISAGGLSIPAYAHPKVFRVGIHNNPPWPRPKGGGA